MSEMDDNKTNQFDHMSTEELEQLIRVYAQSTNDADMDVVFSILEVIEKREKLKPSGKYTDVDAAWVSFQKNYRPTSYDAESICDFNEVIDNQAARHSDIDEPQVRSTGRSGRRIVKHKAILRTACILLSLIILLFSSTVIAKAFGYDLWKAVAKWTNDTFGFSSSVSNTPKPYISNELKSLQDALDRYGITTNLIPSWLPDGYVFQNININPTPAQTSFIAIYLNNNNSEIIVSITSFSNPQFQTYEKDDKNITVYSVQGIDYYIMSNIEHRSIIWQTKTYECSISGDFSLDIARKIIESIYERNKP